MSEKKNALLNMAQGLPRFSEIKPGDVKEAVEVRIGEYREAVEKVLKKAEASGEYTYESIVEPLESASDAYSRVWSPVSHMNSVVSTDELRQAHDECLPVLSEFSSWLGQHEGLYAAYVKLSELPDFKSWPRARQKAVTDALLDFRLSGIGLPEAKRARYAEIVSELSTLTSAYSNNVLDATMGWHKQVTDKNLLAGLPESAVAAAAARAKEKGLDGYVFTLDFPSYFPVMQYADCEELRRECYEAYVTRASDQGPNAGKWDNLPVMKNILALRHELAELLGFSNYAEYSLATKMAKDPAKVVSFLRGLRDKAYDKGCKEYEELVQFAKNECGASKVDAWDVAYYSEKLKIRDYGINSEMVRPYFPLNKVLAGLFETAKRVFGLEISLHEGDVDVWHEDVSFYDVRDASGKLRGSFFLDPYARSHKNGGAWMDECLGYRRFEDGSEQRPVAYLVMSFDPPVGNKPSLLTHDMVTTLFHEFGHGLNLMLTEIDVPAVSGINGVSWDAVELPSQFLESWCWEAEALSYISCHVETGNPLPEELLKNLLRVKNYHAASFILRQLQFGLFDFNLHMGYRPGKERIIEDTVAEVRKLVNVAPVPEFNRFQNAFTHVFSGGYAAGYYSYLWSELLSTDAFGRFLEEGIFNRRAGDDFVRCILADGGSRESMDQFVEFRGREPRIDALLRHYDLV